MGQRRLKVSATGIDPESSLPLEPGTFTPDSFPYPAEGVEILTVGESRLGERIWIGGTKRGIEVTRHLRFFALDEHQIRPNLFAAIRAIDGSRSIASIVQPLGIDLSDFSRLLRFLEEETLILFAHSPITRNGERDGETTRREVEQVHLPAGTSLSKRSDPSILITPTSPIADSIASLLFGSGFERIKFLDEGLSQTRTSHGQLITDLDLGLSIFNGSDVGAQRRDKLKEIANRSAILPLPQDRIPTSPDFSASLTISVGYPRPDLQQRWLSEDRTIFLVPGYSQREVRIGPILIPGKTPCLRCYELGEVENNFWREQVRQLRQLRNRSETPKVASILIASLASHFATLWLDAGGTGKSNHPLFARQYILDLDSMDHRYETWRAHPQCGCSEIGYHSSKPRMKSRA